jgi:hypothetical protein
MLASSCIANNLSYALLPPPMNQDPSTFMQTAWSAIPYRTAIGLAKDGRIIWSPYSSGSTPYAYCDVDVCNGITVNNFYGYASTFFSPYTVGCFGAGSFPSFS